MPDEKMWAGNCEECGVTIRIAEHGIREGNPDFTEPIPDRFKGVCGECGEQIQMELEQPVTITEMPFSNATLLSPAPGLCPACAVPHDPAEPHNQQSLHYQYWFRLREAKAGREERWPTWDDAMAHCTPEVQDLWRDALRERGADL
jgi:hypothetical protein